MTQAVTLAGLGSTTPTIVSPTLTSPVLGTPVSGSLVNCTDVNYTGFKNRIINGNFNIWQRGTTFTGVSTGPTPIQYTADRWYSSNYYNGGGALIVVSKNTDGLQAVWSGTPTTTGRLKIGQAIESLNCKDLWGSPITITVVVKAVGGSNVASVVIGSNTTDVSFPAGSTVTASSPAVTINSSTFTTITLTTTLPSAPSTTASLGLLIDVAKSSGTDASGDGMIIQSVQLEKGSVATSFDQRAYSQELAMCQRYLPALRCTGSSTFEWFGTGLATSTTNVQGYITFPVTPRVKPTGVTTGGNYITSTGSGTAQISTAQTFFTSSIAGSTINFTTVGVTAGQPSLIGFRDTASTLEAILFTGCEL